MRSDYVKKPIIEHILAGLMPENRLALQVSLVTGFRINDVLSLKTEQIKRQRFTIREQKTGKTKSARIPNALQRELLSYAGQIYCFEHRLNGKEHRTRQAVFKDLKRLARAYHIKENLSPHSMRKVYAVEEYQKDGNLKRIQKLLNHSDEAVTYLYALSNLIGKRNTKFRKNKHS